MICADEKIDGKELVKLIGFGSARKMNHEKSVSSIDKDKQKHYIPPEIMSGSGSYARSADVWGLGLLLH